MFNFKFIWILLLIYSLFKNASCSGTVEIRLLKFINPGGVGANGHCCDGRGPFCFSDCDHKFDICIDDSEGPDNINSCPYYRRDTGEITNSNTVTFGSTIAGVENPIKIPFESWPGELKLKVDVWDVDNNGNDHVDYLSGIFGLKASRTEATAAITAFQIRKRTLLTYNVKVYCDVHFFGEYCDTYCKPSEDFGHYTCDSTTGYMICDEGWSGAQCDRNDINECLNSPCDVNQTCIDTPQGYECQCPDGFFGPDCIELVNATCNNSTCQNGGTCEIYRGHIVCDCPHGFIGLTCEIPFDHCDDVQCQNNGTCIIELDNFACECPVGYSGQYCEKIEPTASRMMPSPTTLPITTTTLPNNTPTSMPNTILNSVSLNVTDAIQTTTIEMTTIVLSSTAKYISTTEIRKQSPEITTQTIKENAKEMTVVPTVVHPFLRVRGRVDKNNKESVGKGIRDLLYNLLTINDQLYLNLKYQVDTTSEGDIVSKIIITSAKDGVQEINGTTIQKILDETPTSVIEQHIHLPVIRERPLVVQSHHAPHHHNSFMHDYWFVVVILVLIVICIIIAVGIFILYKHKQLKPKEEVPKENPAVCAPSSSSQSFDNSLYFEMKKNNLKTEQKVNNVPIP